eukprot:gene12040-5436_t
MNSTLKHLSYSFNQPDFSDISFILTDRRRVYAHKFILASQSKVLDDLCSNECNTEINVNENPDAFFQCLKFLYFGDCDVTPMNMKEIKKCSETYGLKSIVEACNSYSEELQMQKSVTTFGDVKPFNSGSTHGPGYLLGYKTDITNDCYLWKFGVYVFNVPDYCQFAVYDFNKNLVAYTNPISSLAKGKKVQING